MMMQDVAKLVLAMKRATLQKEKSSKSDDSDDVNFDDMTDAKIKEFTMKKESQMTRIGQEIMKIRQKETNGVYVNAILDAQIKFYEALNDIQGEKLAAMDDYRNRIGLMYVNTGMVRLTADEITNTYHLVREYCSANDDIEQKLWRQLNAALLFTHNFTDRSSHIAIAFAETPGFLEALFTVLNDINDSRDDEDTVQHPQFDAAFIEHNLAIVHNIALREENFKRLKQVEFTKVLPPFLRKSSDRFSVYALTVLAVTITEDECNILDANHTVIQYVLDILESALQDKSHYYQGWSCFECGFIIRQLARNDNNKKMLGELGVFELLVKLGSTGIKKEIYESVNAIWQLCFNEDNKEKVVMNQKIGVLDLLMELYKSQDEKIQKPCKGTLRLLSPYLQKSTNKKYGSLGLQFDNTIRNTTSNQSSQGHVMISYSHDDTKIVKPIYDAIVKAGYKVWIDFDMVKGGDLDDEIAKAVENSMVVLICVSSSYKSSSECREEAGYVKTCGRPIIPLKLDRQYKPDGWLGKICASKFFYEFSEKHPFKETVPKLLHEISEIYSSSTVKTKK